MKRSSLYIAVLAAAIGFSPVARASVYYQQNFDGLADGSINGQDGWNDAPGRLIVQDTVAVSGKALRIDGFADQDTGRADIFDSGLTKPQEEVHFDFRFEDTIVAHTGTPGVNMLNFLMFRGPVDTGPTPPFPKQVTFRYFGLTDSGGNVTQNGLQLGGDTLLNSHGVFTPQPDTWYHARLDFDWTGQTADLLVTDLDQQTVLWDPAALAMASNGNVDSGKFFADPDPLSVWYIDNFTVGIPEPSTMLLLLTGGGLVWYRRRG